MKSDLRLFAVVVTALLAAAVPAQLGAGTITLTFEGLPDSTVLVTQYAGLTISNAVVVSAEISLDEDEFPPHSGNNVAFDNGGPVTVSFASAVQSFSGYFTYGVPVTVQAFDASNNLLASSASRFSSNEGLSGVSGSQPNEPLAVNTSTNIAMVVITGSAGGTSFTMDDVTVSSFTQCDLTQAGAVNVVDVQLMINQALGVIPAVNYLDGGSVVNVVDVQIEINAALGLGCAAR